VVAEKLILGLIRFADVFGVDRSHERPSDAAAR